MAAGSVLPGKGSSAAGEWLARGVALLAAAWVGLLVAVALLATPAPFATLAAADAGRVVAHIFAREAPTSLVLGTILLIHARRAAAWRAARGLGTQFSLAMGLALGALVCTVVGYYVLQPMMAQARLGVATPLGFAALHGLSFGLFGLKILLVLGLALRHAQSLRRA